MATFGDAERNIQRLLAIGQSFVLSGVDYIIRKSGKPTCSKGEPKTDIYVLAESKDRALLVEIKALCQIVLMKNFRKGLSN